MFIVVLISLVQFPNAFHVLQDPAMKEDPLYGTSVASMRCIIVASAYFFYDVYICTTRYSENGLPFLIHGVLCCMAYTYPLLTGNMHFQGACFLMWELSTPFLYFRWFLIKTNRTDSILMVIANALFALSFFGCRIAAGPFLTMGYLNASEEEISSQRALQPRDNPIPISMLYVYKVALMVLNGLNYYWFYNIVKIAVTGGKKNNVTETDVTPAGKNTTRMSKKDA